MPIGIVTDRDIVITAVAGDPDHINYLLVGDVMTSDVVTALEQDSIDGALNKMQEHGIRRLPIVDRAGTLVGILTLDDILRYLTDQQSELVAPGRANSSANGDAASDLARADDRLLLDGDRGRSEGPDLRGRSRRAGWRHRARRRRSRLPGRGHAPASEGLFPPAAGRVGAAAEADRVGCSCRARAAVRESRCRSMVAPWSWKRGSEASGHRRLDAVFFLDTDVDENAPEDRALKSINCTAVTPPTGWHRRSSSASAACACCGRGCAQIHRFHLNEGHSALLVMELISERLRSAHRTTATDEDVEAVRRMYVFTTHTPVSAAHDQFPPDLAERVLGPTPMSQLLHRCCYGGALNTTAWR